MMSAAENKLIELFSKVPVKPVNYFKNRQLFISVQIKGGAYYINLPFSSTGNTQDFNTIKELLKSIGFRYTGAPDFVWIGDRPKYAILAGKIFEYLPVEARVLAYHAGASNKYIERAKYLLEQKSDEALDTNTDIEINKGDLAQTIQKDIEYVKSIITTLYDYQTEGLRMILNAYYKREKGFILADEQGLGKTVQAIAFLLSVYKKDMTVLIITPDIMMHTWYDKFYEFDTIDAIKQKVTLKKPRNGAINLLNYASLTAKNMLPAVLSLNPDILILDEAHNLKNIQSKRNKNIQPILEKCKFILALTGTIAKNRPMEAYNIMRITNLLPTNITNIVSFIKAFEGDLAAHYYRLRVFTKYYRTIEADKARALLDYLKSTGRYVRRTKQEVLSQLPSKYRIFVTLSLDKDNTELIEALEKENEIADMLNADIKIPRDVAMRISTYRRIIGLAKVKYVVSYIVSKLADKDKFIIYAHHKEVINSLRDLLKEYMPDHNIYILTGDISRNERMQSIVAFQSEAVQKAIIIASLAVASEGITLTATDEIVFAEIDYVPATMMQAEDRIHRISQKSNICTYHYIIATRTLDQYIYNVIRHKNRYLQHINNVN